MILAGKRRFRRGYAWPNPAFPFNLFFDSPKCRIFIIDNITHNWRWMEEWKDGIRETDFFFVRVGWYQSPDMIRDGVAMLEEFGLDKRNFFVLANSEDEMEGFLAAGIASRIISANSWIDQTTMNIRPVEKVYDAIYVARLTALKRHHLAARIANLAIVAGNAHRPDIVKPPESAFLNDKPLSQDAVAEMMNRSRVGLVLSATEGACKVSNEYMLCGLPVVSTRSTGGRHVWYDDYNAIVCDDDEQSVADAVDFFLRNPRDPQTIRGRVIEQAKVFEKRFVTELDRVFKRFGETDQDAGAYFRKNRVPNLRSSHKPNFDVIFGR